VRVEELSMNFRNNTLSLFFLVSSMMTGIITATDLDTDLDVSGADVDDDFREPWIENHKGYFSKEDCNEIIKEAEAFGFPDTADSIDYGDERGTVSWAIDVYTNEELLTPKIADIYKKYLPKMTELVREKKILMNNGDTSEPSLDWIFLRKYSAGAERHMLRLHQDTNLFTINIALNDDFEGGGIFYHKNKDSYFFDDDPIPELPQHVQSYDFLETVERKNSTEQGIVFPHLEQGDMMMHNHTLYHAIAPIQKGTRYSLVFFFDEEHEHVKKHLNQEEVIILFNHFDFPVDLYVIDIDSPKLKIDLVKEDVPEELEFDGMSTEAYIVKNKAGEVVYEFEIERSEEEDDEVEIHIGPEEWFDEQDRLEEEGFFDDEEFSEDFDEEFDDDFNEDFIDEGLFHEEDFADNEDSGDFIDGEDAGLLEEEEEDKLQIEAEEDHHQMVSES